MTQRAAAEVQNQAQTSKASAGGKQRRKPDRFRKKKPVLQRFGQDFSQISAHSRSPKRIQAKLTVNAPETSMSRRRTASPNR